MFTKYESRHKTYWDNEGYDIFEKPGPVTVYPENDGEVWSGLFDASGDPLFRLPNPIGFRRN
jgi:hypothetical protein